MQEKGYIRGPNQDGFKALPLIGEKNLCSDWLQGVAQVNQSKLGLVKAKPKANSKTHV